jgi:DNA-binding MarR family transcriptional regulator
MSIDRRVRPAVRGALSRGETAGRSGRDNLLPAERKVMDRLGRLPLDFRAMAAVSNLFRAATAVRRHMEAQVLAGDRLSWTSFAALWVMWVWGRMELHALAAAVGVSRPTTTGVVATLKRRGFVHTQRGTADARTVFVVLTPRGRRTIQRLFPRFNSEEAAVVATLALREQEALASLLRTVLRTVDGVMGSALRAQKKGP